MLMWMVGIVLGNKGNLAYRGAVLALNPLGTGDKTDPFFAYRERNLPDAVKYAG
jgi:hypothetical protein